MAGTETGGRKAAQTNKKKYGKNFYAQIGAKGGSVQTSKPKGFAANRDLARKAGQRGGKNSKRGKARG